MFSKTAVISSLWLAAAVPVLAAGHAPFHASVPPASFLNYHASTVHELSQEVTLDPAVRARLANHFHITEAQITQYVRRNLVLTHLKQGGTYRIACVAPNGHEYWIQSHLPAGTAIFASRVTGNPILKLACGNPMVSSLPPTVQMGEDNGSLSPPQLASLPPAPTDASPMPGLLGEDVTPITLADAAADVTPAVVLVSDFPPIGPIGPAAGRSFNVLPAILGGLALGVVGSGGHHGSTPNIVPPPPVVPEAATSLSLGAMLLMGVGALLVLRRKKASGKTV